MAALNYATRRLREAAGSASAWLEQRLSGDMPNGIREELESALFYFDAHAETQEPEEPEDEEQAEPDLRVCADCLQFLANGSEELEPARVAEIEAGMAEAGGNVVLGGEELGFSWTPCGLCKSPLGGERYGASVIEVAERRPLDSPDSESWAEAQGEESAQ